MNNRILKIALAVIGLVNTSIFFGQVYPISPLNFISDPGFDECILTGATPVYNCDNINAICPVYSSFAKWQRATNGSTDQYKSCGAPGGSPFNQFTPTNAMGYQVPRSYDGYGGFIAYSDNPFSTGQYREYFKNPWTSTGGGLSLEEGEEYCFSCYVSLADTSYYAVHQLGVLVGGIWDYLNPTYSEGVATITPTYSTPADQLLSDTADWIQIQFTFIANGGENHVVIGNFNDDTISNIQTVRDTAGTSQTTELAYYYIEDVCLTKIGDSFCDGCPKTDPDITITDTLANIVTPNGDGINDYFAIPTTATEWQCDFYNRWGELISSMGSAFSGLDWNGRNLEGEEVTEGVYYYVYYDSTYTTSGLLHLIR